MSRAKQPMSGPPVVLSQILFLATEARCTIEEEGGLTAKNYYLSHPALGEFVRLEVRRGSSDVADIAFASPQVAVAPGFMLEMKVALGGGPQL